MKAHLFDGTDFSVLAPTDEWSYVWVDALPDSTLHIYFRCRKWCPLDGFPKVLQEKLAYVAKLDNGKWGIFDLDGDKDPVEFEPGRFYDTSEQAFEVVENHEYFNKP